MMNQYNPYRAYLLRAWREADSQSGDPGPWRFSLEQPGADARRGFRSLAELTAHLRLTFTVVNLAGEPDAPSPDVSWEKGNE